jgi:hypothetical protein
MFTYIEHIAQIAQIFGQGEVKGRRRQEGRLARLLHQIRYDTLDRAGRIPA